MLLNQPQRKKVNSVQIANTGILCMLNFYYSSIQMDSHVIGWTIWIADRNSDAIWKRNHFVTFKICNILQQDTVYQSSLVFGSPLY